MELLNDVLKAKYNLENTLKLCHWVSNGRDFSQYHAMFADLYEMASKGTDELVELGIALGFSPNFDSFGGVVATLEDRSCQNLLRVSANMLTTYMAKLFELRGQMQEKPMAVGLVAHIEELAVYATKVLYQVSASMEKE